MQFKPINHTELLPFEPYLFKIQAAGETVYTCGVMDSYQCYRLDKYQYLADCIVAYAEIRDDEQAA